MIIGDIETTEKVEYEDLLKNYYEKMEIIEEQDKEIERLNNIINELENFICDLEYECISDTPMWRFAVIIHNKLKELKGEDKK